MFRAVYFFILLLSVSARELSCPSSSSSTTAAKLKSELLCDYDSYIRPVKDHRNATVVAFRLMLKYFNYDHFSHMLSVDAWFTTQWVDEHLKWKPEDHEGIKTIHLSSSFEIWVPDISIYNRKDQSTEPNVISSTMCAVSYTGTVLCVPPVHFDSLCVPDLQKYPYDVQKCTVRFGSWVHKGEEINLKLVNPVVDTADLESNGEWQLVSFKGTRNKGNYSCCPNATYPSVDIVFEIKRHSGAHAINAVLPLIVCILLTITTMAMSPLNKDRLILSCVNVIVHIYHVANVGFMVPLNGEKLPSLLSISRDSTLLAGVSIIATILLKYLMQLKNGSPSWISGTVSILISSRPGQIILLKDRSLKGAAAAENKEDGVTIISNSELDAPAPSEDWVIFGRLFDILLFSIYIIIYTVMLLSF